MQAMDLNHASLQRHQSGGLGGGVPVGGVMEDYSFESVQTSGGSGGREDSRGVNNNDEETNAWYDTDL